MPGSFPCPEPGMSPSPIVRPVPLGLPCFVPAANSNIKMLNRMLEFPVSRHFYPRRAGGRCSLNPHCLDRRCFPVTLQELRAPAAGSRRSAPQAAEDFTVGAEPCRAGPCLAGAPREIKNGGLGGTFCNAEPPPAPQVMGQGWHRGSWCYREDTAKLILRATAKSSLAPSEVPVLSGDQRARAFRRRPLPSHPLTVREHEEEGVFYQKQVSPVICVSRGRSAPLGRSLPLNK